MDSLFLYDNNLFLENMLRQKELLGTCSFFTGMVKRQSPNDES